MNYHESIGGEAVKLVADDGAVLKGHALKRSFFDMPAPMVAWDILGKVLIHETPSGVVAGKIVETEAYLGGKDPACHASAGNTKRNEIFHSEPGTVYVFSSFGIYNCMNVLTSGESPSGCVLLRAVEPLVGLRIMKRNRETLDPKQLTNGPGKLAKSFGITKHENGWTITKRPLIIADCGFNSFVPSIDSRIGVSKAVHYPFRYFLPDNPYVSRPQRKLFSMVA